MLRALFRLFFKDQTMSEPSQVSDGVLIFEGEFRGEVEDAGARIQAAISGYYNANPKVPGPVDGVDIKLNPGGHFTISIKVRTTIEDARAIRDGIGQALRNQGLDLGESNASEYTERGVRMGQGTLPWYEIGSDDPVPALRIPVDRITHSLLILDTASGLTDGQLVDALRQIHDSNHRGIIEALEAKGLAGGVKMAPVFAPGFRDSPFETAEGILEQLQLERSTFAGLIRAISLDNGASTQAVLVSFLYEDAEPAICISTKPFAPR